MRFRLFGRLKDAVVRKMWRSVLARSMGKLADDQLDVLIGGFERNVSDNKDVALMNARLEGVGIDWLQELKNEKFLREHRKKHGKISG